MPAKDQTNPESLPTTIREWFQEHPGWHRCQEVARDLGHEHTWRVANECGRLYRQNRLVRQRIHVKGRSMPISYYGDPAMVVNQPMPTPDAPPDTEETA